MVQGSGGLMGVRVEALGLGRLASGFQIWNPSAEMLPVGYSLGVG